MAEDSRVRDDALPNLHDRKDVPVPVGNAVPGIDSRGSCLHMRVVTRLMEELRGSR